MSERDVPRDSWIYGPRPEDDEIKEIKVKIPELMHKKLHEYKVLTGVSITIMVNEALDAYFKAQDRSRDERRG